MSDRADSSAHPEGAAITRPSVSDHESDTTPITRWAELYRLLVGPACTDPAYALVPSPKGGNDASRAATAADPAELIADAERVGAGRAEVAVVATIRPELLVVDLDGCAAQVLQQVLTAATGAGGLLAYLAASGSPDSVHVAFAVTPARRSAVAQAVDAVRRAAGLDPKTVDVRTPRHYLRLPGSMSLKGGERCWPITDDGARMTAIATASRLRTALAVVEGSWSRSDIEAALAPTLPSGPRDGVAAQSASADTVADGGPDVEVGVALSAVDVEAPYAWGPPKRMTAEHLRVLNRAPGPGKRSDAATAGAWVLIDLKIRSWRTAKPFYDRYPCFVKFRERDQHAIARGTRYSARHVSHSYKHWRHVLERFRSYQPAVSADDQALITDVLAEVACWDDANLVAAAVAVVHHRFSDGHGTADRPLADRCLAGWLAVEHTTAQRRLKGLLERGLLELVVPHDRYAARHEAHRYRLRRPSILYRTNLRHDVTCPPSLTHPLWGVLGQSVRHVWEKLRSEPAPTAVLAELTGQRTGTASHGTKKALDALCAVGLARRRGTGPRTVWVRSETPLDAVADHYGATARHRFLLATINTEREAWHAITRRARAMARTKLAYLHTRQHTAADGAAPAADQLALFTPVMVSGEVVDDARGVARRARGGCDEVPRYGPNHRV